MKPLLIALGTLVVSLPVAGYVLYTRDQPRPGQEVVDRAQQRLSLAELTHQSALTLPPLPPLASNWTKINSLSLGCALNLEPKNSSAETRYQPYAGPAGNWEASLSGPPLPLLACLWVVSLTYPVVINAVDLTPGIATAFFSVLGSPQDPS